MWLLVPIPAAQHGLSSTLKTHLFLTAQSWLCVTWCVELSWSFPVACSDSKANMTTPSKAQNGLSSSFLHCKDFYSARSRTWIKLFLPFLPPAMRQKGQAWGITCTTRKTLLKEAVKSYSCCVWEITWGHLPSTFLLGTKQWGNRNSQSWNCWFVNSRETLTWRFIQIFTICITESLQK